MEDTGKKTHTVVEGEFPDLVPVRMVSEYAFCPRLFYLEWVQGECIDFALPDEGRSAHFKTDSSAGEVPPSVGSDGEKLITRATEICAPILGITGSVDVVPEDGGGAIRPILCKRAGPSDASEGTWESDRLQLAVDILILRESGYTADTGIVFYKESHRREDVVLDEKLERSALQTIQAMRACARSHLPPPPLHLSPKCAGCPLNVICLPDEIGMIQGVNSPDAMRLLYPPNDDALPVYIQGQGSRIGISSGVLQVRPPYGKDGEGKTEEIRLNEMSQLNVYGNVGMTSAAIRELCNEGIPVGFFSQGGWFFGRLEGLTKKNIDLRRAQYRAAEDRDFSLRIARRVVSAKIANCRTMLRRNHASAPKDILDSLERSVHDAEESDSIQTLLGIEGNAAKVYFSAFSGMLKAPACPEDKSDDNFDFDFTCRNRRPPKDPVNVLLSYAYGMLAKDLTNAATLAGLDPLLGFYHQPRYGRPSLALDLMEEFRPLIADSAVLQCINTGIIKPGEFVRTGLGVGMTQNARRKLIQTYERRMDQFVTHPVFGYRISYRRVLAVQARLLGRFLMGEIESFPSFLTR